MLLLVVSLGILGPVIAYFALLNIFVAAGAFGDEGEYDLAELSQVGAIAFLQAQITFPVNVDPAQSGFGTCKTNTCGLQGWGVVTATDIPLVDRYLSLLVHVCFMLCALCFVLCVLCALCFVCFLFCVLCMLCALCILCVCFVYFVRFVCFVCAMRVLCVLCVYIVCFVCFV
jgi:hypothetical protein